MLTVECAGEQILISTLRKFNERIRFTEVEQANQPLSVKPAAKTEDLIGPYALTDFFIYYTVKYGYSPTKTFSLATKAFADEYDRETVKKWLVSFYKRFFFSAFKRNALPDGIRIGSISLSPRGDFMMPSDAMSELFVSEAENL